MLRSLKGALIAAALALVVPVVAGATALSITAASVAWQSGPLKSGAVAGEAFAAGAVVYYKNADARWYKAQCDGTAEEAGQNDIGIALGTADAAGAQISIATSGAVVALGTGAAGTFYAIGTTAGQIVPVGDLATTNKATLVGLGIGSNKLLISRVYNAGAVVP